jgi:hypothetical protein
MSFELRQFAVWPCADHRLLTVPAGQPPDASLRCPPEPKELITIAGHSDSLEENPIPPGLVAPTELDAWVATLRACRCTVIRHQPALMF